MRPRTQTNLLYLRSEKWYLPVPAVQRTQKRKEPKYTLVTNQTSMLDFGLSFRLPSWGAKTRSREDDEAENQDPAEAEDVARGAKGPGD